MTFYLNPRTQEVTGVEVDGVLFSQYEIYNGLKKQIPKKAVDLEFYHECPVCFSVVAFHAKHCETCGQRLEWEENDG